MRRQLVAARAPCIERRSHAGDGGGVLCRTIPLLVRVRRLVEEQHPIPVADQDLRALPETLEDPTARTAAVLADRAVVGRRGVLGGGTARCRREASALHASRRGGARANGGPRPEVARGRARG